MSPKSLLVIGTHGTYGRDDEAYGTLMVCNAFLAKSIDTTLVLLKDGVCMAKGGQSPIGMPNNLDELKDLLDLGGRLICIEESLN
jgi:sulfur relay (sulfurtransferase) complex TusBCD TusD component (DsrE family)